MRSRLFTFAFMVSSVAAGCGGDARTESAALPLPREIIDLGALVTEDLPERVWGKALLVDGGWYDRQNAFEVVRWEHELPGGTVSGSNS